MITGAFYLFLGALLIWIGWRHWRYRNQETISILEAGILKAADEEPLPRTKVDRSLSYLQAGFGFILGPFFLLCGLAVILGELGLL